MKTLQEAKDQVANKYGYQNWKAFVTNEIHKHATTAFWGFIEEAAELYASQHLSALQQENEKLRKFKEYVHNRLDKWGVPADPEPENNAKHGCRIEGRLNYAWRRLRTG